MGGGRWAALPAGGAGFRCTREAARGFDTLAAVPDVPKGLGGSGQEPPVYSGYSGGGMGGSFLARGGLGPFLADRSQARNAKRWWLEVTTHSKSCGEVLLGTRGNLQVRIWNKDGNKGLGRHHRTYRVGQPEPA